MEESKKEMLEKLRNVKSMEEYNLEMLGKADEIDIDDVKYLGEAELNYKIDGKKETYIINVYAVIEGKTIKYYSDDMPLAAETEGVGKKKQEIIPSPEYEKTFEEDNPIRDIIEDLKQNEIEEQEKPEEERSIVLLNDLEGKENKLEAKEKSKNKKQKEDEEIIPEFRIDKSGATSLDQMIDGVTLRNILKLSGEYECIKPVNASKLKGYADVGNKDAIVAIKRNGECTVLDESIIRQDRQEGKNSFNQDLNINNDGSVEYKSNTSSYQIVNRPNYYISVGYDEGSKNKEIKISKRSGREGDKEVEFELHKYGAAEYEESDARRLRQSNEDGIGKSDIIVNKQKGHEEIGCENDRVENIDNYENNNMHKHGEFTKESLVPGERDKTIEEWADELGESVEAVIGRLNKEIEDNPESDLEDVVKEIEYDYGMIEHTRDRI